MEKEIIRYTKEGITVLWNPKICVHSGVCVRGLSQVFNPKKRPWINMDAAGIECIINQVKKCPSGAISIENQESPSGFSEG
jgi:uncharacterized Fe-S cluster protein YjdI